MFELLNSYHSNWPILEVLLTKERFQLKIRRELILQGK